MKNKKAFTLVELAIVLIIIGLITGGVVGAQSLIESAQKQGLINEASQYATGINAFVLEYGELPGKFNEATEYWGTTYIAADGNTEDVANGGANSLSNLVSCSIPWQHLGLSEILPTKYREDGCQVVTRKAGIDFPVAATGDEDAWFLSDNTDYADWVDGRGGPVYGKNRSIYLIASAPNSVGHEAWGVLSAKAARDIDKRIDDGNPALGKFFAIKGYVVSGDEYQSGCVDQEPGVSSTTNVSYILSNDDPHCRPMFFINVNK